MNKKYFKIICWLVIVILAFFIHWDHAVNTDEGEILAGAWRIYQGQTLYFDFFHFLAPGAFYFIALGFKLLGPTYLAAKVFSILFLLAAAGGLFLLSRFFINKKVYLYLIPLIWLLISTYYPLINHNQFSIFVFIWALYFFLKSLRDNSRLYFFLSGIGNGLIFLVHQSKGLVFVVTALFLMVVFNFRNFKKFLYFLAGLLLVSLLWLYWPIKLIFNNLIYFPINHYLPVNQVELWPLVVILIIWVGLAAGLYFLKVNQEVWSLWLVQLFLFLSSLSRPDVYHLIIYSFLAPIIIFVVLEKSDTRRLFKFHAYFWANAATIGFFLLYFSLSDFYTTISRKSFFEFMTLDNRPLDEIADFVQSFQPSSDDLYAGPLLPNMYLEMKKNNISRYNSLLTNFNTGESFLEVRNDLITKQPPVILMNYQLVKKFGYQLDNPVDNYIQENYRLATELYGIKIFKLATPAP